MAHEKVERRSMSLEHWARLMFEQVEALIVDAAAPTGRWRVRVGQYAPEGYTWDGPAQPIADGEPWGRPDGTAVFEGTAVIPKRMAGRKVWLQMAIAAETIVYVNGRLCDGLDPNRSRVLVKGRARGGERLKLRMEAYVRSKPDDDRDPRIKAIRGCVQRFRQPELVVVNEEHLAARHDLHVLYAAAFGKALDDDVRERLLRDVREVLKLMPPFESGREALAASLPRVRRYLREHVFTGGAGPFGHTGRLACVAHSHLDIAYHWRVRQSVQKNARTCLIQLRLMERYPEFKYSHSQAWTYETLEKFYPELFRQVRRRVAEGRWEIVGGLYVEPDCNLPSAESLARQILYAKRYFLGKFGVEVDNVWLPDVFGNSAIMPQILRAGGIGYFVSNKMSTWNDTNMFPHNQFVWRGLDGTEVFACVPPLHFITWMEPDQVLEGWQRFLDKDVSDESLHMYGYGDGGSGANDEMLELYERLKVLPGLPALRLTTGREYLHSAFDGKKGLAVWDGELYLEMHRGTFTTKGALKRENRRGEFLALETEALATCAALAGGKYPRAELEEAWKLLLLNQFHDILPGSHTAAVFADAMEDYAAMREKFDACRRAALDRLAPPAARDALCVFNPFGFARDGLAVVEAADADSTLAAVDEDGTRRAAEWQAVAGGGRRLVVETGPVAPLAFKNLTLVPAQAAKRRGASEAPRPGAANAPAPELVAVPRRLENRFFRLEFDRAGRLVRLFDKRAGREAFAPGEVGNAWQLFEDRPGTYNAWDILERYEDHPIAIGEWASVEPAGQGPVSASLRLRRRFGASSAEQIIRLFAAVPRIDFETFVDWHEDERLLKVAFPLAVRSRHYTTDTSAGGLERPSHRNTTWEQARFEVCCHKWVHVGEGLFGVGLMNDSKYGCDVKGGTVRLSLLRAPIRPDRESDRGEHRFTYSLWTDGGDWRRGGLVEAAYDLNWPMRALRGRAAVPQDSRSGKERRVGAPHPRGSGGKMPPAGETHRGMMEISTPALHVQSLKMDEDGKGDVVLRLIELYGSHGTATVRPNFAFKSAAFCDLLERPTAAARASSGAVKVAYRPYQLFTLRFRR